MKKWPKYLKRLLRILLGLGLAVVLLIVVFNRLTKVTPPRIDGEEVFSGEKEVLGPESYRYGDSWLQKNTYGIWELYVAGAPFEMGYKNGLLTDSLNALQEQYFVDGIRELVPSDAYLNKLKYFLAWYNRKLDSYIPLDLQQEIYGVSHFASDSFNFIGGGYERMLNYHAAHDIGHALQNMNLVACTAFAVQDEASEDGALLVGRNMDFSMGDDFASNKLVTFFAPETGYAFASISWAGMIGVISGMNSEGLVVTLNAANSGIPFSARKPVSILAREVLQHAATIAEAYALIEEAKVFVAESFLVVSARDRKAVVIEKSIDETALYESGSRQLVLTNHFQSEALKDTELNVTGMADESTTYRMERVKELLGQRAQHSPASFAGVLRDQEGLQGANLGWGNEKAINQLIAHHSVIFQPEALKMWVAANPYALGAYVCYDLGALLAEPAGYFQRSPEELEVLAADPFLVSADYKRFEDYKTQTRHFQKLLRQGEAGVLSEEELQGYSRLNPDNYHSWFVLGELWLARGEKAKARASYLRALDKVVARKSERERIEARLAALDDETK